MTFDFFNTSDLAFGTKLTSAFKTLTNLKDEAKINVTDILANIGIFQEYLNRNYQVPAPIKPTSACRTDEIFNLVKDEAYINTVRYDSEDSKFKVSITFFDKLNSRITVATGETELKEGYACVVKAISNKNMNKTIRFVEEEKDIEGSETVLFRFIVDDDIENKVKLYEIYDKLYIFPYDFSQYRAIEKGEDIQSPYTATKDECICVAVQNGYGADNSYIKLNGTRIYHINNGTSSNMRNHLILYLQKDDKVEWYGTHGQNAFKILYK